MKNINGYDVPSYQEFFKLAEDCRIAQREYFRARRYRSSYRDELDRALALEKKLDSAITSINLARQEYEKQKA